MATYYAVTTENAQLCGWEIYAIAGSRAAALAAAEAKIGADVHEQTRRINLRVWSRSAARRLVGPAQLDWMLEQYTRHDEPQAERWPRINNAGDIYEED